MPRVSVIVPVYNVEPYLAECVNSIIAQSFADIEIILVDDGSQDNSGTLCDAYAAKDNRIKVIHKENGGLSSARLAGFRIATGEYIAFVDSDDWVAQDLIEKALASIQNHKADVCLFGHVTVSASGHRQQPITLNQVNDSHAIIENILIPMAGEDKDAETPYIPGFVWVKLYKRSLIEERFFVSERLYFAEDVVFNLHVFSKAQQVTVVNEGLYFYRYNDESLSNSYRENIWEKLERLFYYMVGFYEERGLTHRVRKRLNTELFKFTVFSINNECKKTNQLTFSLKTSNIRKILKSDVLVPWRDAYHPHKLSLIQKIYLFCIKRNMAMVLTVLGTLKMRIYKM